MLEEKFADQMWLGELVTRIEKEEQEMCIRDCEKEEMVLQMYDALKRSVEKATVSYELNAPFKSMGYVSFVGKSVDVFEELQEHQQEAIQYAKERVDRLTRDQINVICRNSNPVTTVYELVEFLNSKKI